MDTHKSQSNIIQSLIDMQIDIHLWQFRVGGGKRTRLYGKGDWHEVGRMGLIYDGR